MHRSSKGVSVADSLVGKLRSAVLNPAGLAQPEDGLLHLRFAASAFETHRHRTHRLHPNPLASPRQTYRSMRQTKLEFSGREPECVQSSITTSGDVCPSRLVL